MTLPASEGLVRFQTVGIGTIGRATRMGISYRRGLPCIWLRLGLRRRRHGLTIGRWGALVEVLGKREAGCPEKGAQCYTSRQETVHDTYTSN
jgi:hypothetical protein